MNEQRPFDPAGFLQKLARCQEQANSAVNPKVVRAKPLEQAGRTALVGACACGEVAALSGEGRHLCRRCGAWLRYVRED